MSKYAKYTGSTYMNKSTSYGRLKRNLSTDLTGVVKHVRYLIVYFKVSSALSVVRLGYTAM